MDLQQADVFPLDVTLLGDDLVYFHIVLKCQLLLILMKNIDWILAFCTCFLLYLICRV